MFKRLFGQGQVAGNNDAVGMPEVEEPPNIGEVFDNARRVAAGVGVPPQGHSGQHVIIVTPGRLLMFQPCPPPGSMSEQQVEPVRRMIPPTVKRNIAAIAYTELQALQSDISRAIPFFGFLLGFAYIGHAVWVFEGHSAALEAGCKDADVLFVDGQMVPFLREDWAAVASGVMRRPEIYVHDRKTYSLSKVS